MERGGTSYLTPETPAADGILGSRSALQTLPGGLYQDLS